MSEGPYGTMCVPRRRDTGRWGYGPGWRNPATEAVPGRPGWTRMVPNQTPSYWHVFNSEDKNAATVYECDSEGAAQAEALRRHGQDVERYRKRVYPPPQRARLQRLEALGETFYVRYGEGERHKRWPKSIGRYGVSEWSDSYQESFWSTCETIPEVEDMICQDDVDRVVDLDTGRDLPFTLTAQLQT